MNKNKDYLNKNAYLGRGRRKVHNSTMLEKSGNIYKFPYNPIKHSKIVLFLLCKFLS